MFGHQAMLRRHQSRFIIDHSRPVTLRAPRLIQDPTRTTLRHLQPDLDLTHRLPLARRAYGFPNKSIASFRIALSNSDSASNRFSRVFSCSRSFSRLASGTCIRPYF